MEVGHETTVQALRERGADQERADALQTALSVQCLRPELHRHARPRQAAGPEGRRCSAVYQRLVDEPDRQVARRLGPHDPGLAGAVRSRLRAQARAGRPGGGDRARRDVALPEKSPTRSGSGKLGIVLQGSWWTGSAAVVTRPPANA